jgi:aminoglycoside N3'-acetyltransferase
MTLHEFFDSLFKVRPCHIMVHSSFKAIKQAFNEVTADDIISGLQKIITPSGSIIMPAFTYCWKKKDGSHQIFDRINSPGQVGYLAEEFRKSKGVIRTNSPTHSFSLWGKVTEYFDETNSPQSPLGKNSILEWLSETQDAFILMIGANFKSNTFCHYLELQAKVPWYDYSPWGYLGVENFGVSIDGEQKLKEIPGCSEGFINFENYLLDKNIISSVNYNNLKVYLIPIDIIFKHGINYFSNNYEKLLCVKGICKACDSRREVYINEY